MSAGGWIETYRANPSARSRLFCFPHAGGAAQAFRGWGPLLPSLEVCAIQPPGRWSRLREPAFRRIEDYAPAAADAILPWLDRPFAFFGHSLGGLVAFEVARVLRGRGAPLPSLLWVSARVAPQLPLPGLQLHTLDDQRFVAEVTARYGGIPPEILADAEMLALLLPAIRGDMEVYETYRYRDEPPLPLPILATGGAEDRLTRPEQLEGWRAQTSASCEVRIFPGGHFYLAARLPEVLGLLGDRLAG